MKKDYFLLVILFFLGLTHGFSQNVSLFKQFNGRFDFTFIGNTLNPNENTFMTVPAVLTSSSALLNLTSNDQIEKCYLYWAGCGPGDFNVKLNTVSLTPDRNFSFQRTYSNGDVYNYFSCFKDVTTQVQTSGNGNYTLSDLDVSSYIDYYDQNSTNFAGWAIIIVYKNLNLPLDQLNIYDGLQAVPSVLDINLNSLNVIDAVGAKIGFLAWEGDLGLADNENLRINGNILSNPPLNPAANAFNGTNSVTNSDTLYNMDLDIYDIQNNIQPGDTNATIQMTSNQDFVMINAIVTKLNSQVPDATIAITSFSQSCNSKILNVNYRVSNLNCTNPLPANTYITFYANNSAIFTTQTAQIIPIDGFINYATSVTIPTSIPNNFTLKIVVDDNNGIGNVIEISETNNSFSQDIIQWVAPEFMILDGLTSCIEENSKGIFDFSSYENLVKKKTTDIVRFFETNTNAFFNFNPILNTSNYFTTTTPKTIFVRIENEHCFSITSFNLNTSYCDLHFYNHITPNEDGFNDNFVIAGLEKYENYVLYIYNRWGKLVWKGDKKIGNWDGFSNQDLVILKESLPTGTYYYVLNLNEANYPENFTGWVYLNR